MIYNDDVIEWAKKYDGEPFHALFTDAPYHLTSIVKRFGKKDSAPAKFGTDGVFSRSSKGFMGNTWDGGDLAFKPETWYSFMPHLHSGAFGMAFASSRGWHRMAVAIEDAGFIIHPTMFGWAYGSGFPKATRVKDERFNGHRYGLQALKPALEPIIVFQKPYEGRPLDNILETGAGALNIDGGRISTNGESYTINTWDDNAHPFGNGAGNEYTGRKESARWPANFLLLDKESEVALDNQSGTLTSGKPLGRKHIDKGKRNTYGNFEGYEYEHTGFGDSGGASRFFFRVSEQIDEADPVYYCAKASRSERDAGLEEPIEGRITPMAGRGQAGLKCRNCGKWKVSGSPCKCDEPDFEQSNFVRPENKNPHPTVKPISLTKYLATLLLPPVDYAPRRLLVPFSGVASEMIGGYLAGWEEVVGVEITKEYIPIAEARIEYWTNKIQEQKTKEVQLGLL